MRDRRDTAIVTARLAGHPVSEVARANGTSERTVRRAMVRWRDGSFELSREMKLCIAIARNAVAQRFDAESTALEPVDPFECLEHAFAGAGMVEDYVALSRALGEDPVPTGALPWFDWAHEVNVTLRRVLSGYAVDEDVIDEATGAVAQWFEQKFSCGGAMSWLA